VNFAPIDPGTVAQRPDTQVLSAEPTRACDSLTPGWPPYTFRPLALVNEEC